MRYGKEKKGENENMQDSYYSINPITAIIFLALMFKLFYWLMRDTAKSDTKRNGKYGR